MRTTPLSLTRIVGMAALVGFVGAVWGANFFIENIGRQPAPGAPHLLPVGFGYEAPSGFVMVGVSLTLRDLVQRLLGPRYTIAGIAVGGVLSGFINTDLAVASAVTFLVAEMADFAVYTPLQDRNLTAAVVASNIVGAVIDSVLFLTLAFGVDAIGDFALPQMLGKIEWSILFLPALWWARSWAARTAAGERSRSVGAHP